MKQSVRIVYRSQKISIPLLEAMEAADAWDKAGLDVERLDYVSGAAESDPMLIDGEIDFIFGSHISPYHHRAKGIPMVCLGQTVNYTADCLVTREPILSMASLRGKVLAELKTKNSHPWGNHQLYLIRGGVDLSEVEFLEANDYGDGRRKPYQLVADGVADAAIVMPPSDEYARRLGLAVQRLPFLPMVQATTLTTMWDVRRDRPEMCRAVIRAVREGIRYFKYERDAMMKVMETTVAPKIGVTDETVLRHLYEINYQLLDERLCPTTEAIGNAYRIAVLQDPSIQETVNPVDLWDIGLLREVDAS